MKIAILGLGVVGEGVYNIINDSNSNIEIKYVLELDKNKLKGKERLLASSFDEIINDEELDTVVELIGGRIIAYEFIKKSLEHRKNVVTANKAVISAYYEELTTLAKTNKVTLLFEASVGGGINILSSLMSLINIDNIYQIKGIINGSTNFVLSCVFQENKSFDGSIKEAEELGYIETGSTDDMDGYDLLRKINILSMISYQGYIEEEDIIRIPLSSLTNEFMDFVNKQNLTIKYIASSFNETGSTMIHLEPVIITNNSIYSSIEYENNIITIDGIYHPNQSFIGKGAGRYPTASAVVSDLFKILNNNIDSVEYTNSITINKELKKYIFLVLENNTFYKTEHITFTELLSNKNITCFARLEEDAYEIL